MSSNINFTLPSPLSFGDNQSEDLFTSTALSSSSSTADAQKLQQKGTLKIENGPVISNVPVAFVAALVGNLPLLKTLVKQCGPSASASLGGKRSIAEFAARGNQVQVLELLVSEFGKDFVDLPNETGITPVAVAVQHGHLETVKYLHESCGVKIDRVFVGNRTLLHMGVRMNRVAVVKYLLSLNKIDKDAQMQVMSSNAPVTAASTKKLAEDNKKKEEEAAAAAAAAAAAENGGEKKEGDAAADIAKEESKSGMESAPTSTSVGFDEAVVTGEANIFALACAEASVEMVTLLIKEQAHVQNLLEATGSSKQIIEKVNADGTTTSDVNNKNSNDDDQQGNQQQQQQLKQEKMIFKKFAGFPVMPMSSSSKKDNNNENNTNLASKKLTEVATYVVHLERKREIIQSPLHIACAQGNLSVVKFLIERTQFDCDKNSRVSGVTPLYLAVRFNKFDVVNYLVTEARVEIDKTSGEGAGSSNTQDTTNFSTPLFAACFYNFVEIAKLLITNGASSSTTYKGASPFIGAIANDSTQCVLLLIELKGDVTSGYKGDSPLAFAKSEGKTGLVKLLTDNNIQ